MATEGASSEIIEKQRTKLLNVLQQDPDSILDTLTSRRLISEEEYETLEEITDPLKKSRKLLILIQKKGEASCCCFLKCLSNAFPASASTLGLKHVPWLGTKETVGVSRDSEDPFCLGTITPENAEIAELSEEKESLGLRAPEFFTHKESDHGEPAVSSWETKEGCGTPQVTTSRSVKRVEYEVPSSITFLRDGQRYEEPDDSLYLEEGEHQEYLGYPEDETVLEEGAGDDPQCFVYDNEEEYEENEETMGFPDEDSNCDHASETSVSLEEEEKIAEERKRVFQHVLSCLNMDRSRKLLPDFVKQFSIDRGCEWTPETPGDLAWNFLMKVQALDLTARDFILRHKVVDEENTEELLAGIEKLGIGDTQTINPLDVLCACMLCADSSLQREVMSNMYQCQFALPLLLPDPENNKSILMMGAMKDLKQHSTQSSGGPPWETDTFVSRMKMPVISFVRLGHCSFSKSRILNTLLSSSQQKPHKFFLHRDLSVPVLPRQISDGLVEVTWCFPDNKELKGSPHVFQKPVAVANLRGDLESFWIQFGFLVEVSSAVFFFTDCLGEKEWDLLMFLGEDAIERCYFILGPQAKESEEAYIFQRILKLKPSQLLFWEVEEAGDRRKTMETLQTALQEVMSSALRCVSLEDMASLARELGIHVDQDFEVTQDTQVSSRTIEGENQQSLSQTKSPPESQAQKPIREPGTQCEDSQNALIFHQTPVFMPYPAHPWPLPLKAGSNFSHVPLRAPWVVSSQFRSQQRAKWFFPFPHQNTSVHSRGQNFGIKSFQPWRFYSRGRFTKCSATPQQYHVNGPFGKSQRQTSHVQSHPEGRQRTLQKSGTVVSRVGHMHSPASQAIKAAGKPQPEKACAQGIQLTKAAGKSIKIPSHIKYPHPQPCQPAGAIQEWIIPISHQGVQQTTQGRPSDLAFKPGSQSTSGSKLSSTSQSSCHQSKFQSKHFQPKPFQPVPSQKKLSHTHPSHAKPSDLNPSHANPTHVRPSHAKPTHSQTSQANSHHPHPSHAKPSHQNPSHANPTHVQPSHANPTHPQPFHAKPTHPQSSQAKPTHPQSSQAKPTHPQSSQAKPSPSQSTQFKAPKPHQSQSKSFQPRPTQPKSSQTKPSQAKAFHPRTGRR
ncbi:caspase recruitment domain-containing protein 6 isoform X1 [Grammomys surdaster]|uniref:caspase recruitment domain-containing protein 6 isoform X1 n=1 Tax=Grammomys surdaster TaxID=491861 RepID=UPI0010A0095F|nr:caspase recruitment domain-containing protein 6 isoform X1 [Grammomys surdaster]